MIRNENAAVEPPVSPAAWKKVVAVLMCVVAAGDAPAQRGRGGGGEEGAGPSAINYAELEEEMGLVQQVTISAKVIEFQTSKDVESGLSAYFQRRNTPRPYGRVSSGNGAISTADITFPTGTNSGITVFLDRLSHVYGDFEMVLQGLVDQNRASIISRPTIKAIVGDPSPAIIKTVQKIPYERTVIAGLNLTQVTAFRDTGVMLSIKVLEALDDDGDPSTTDDIFINIEIEVEVNEEGQRIPVALDDLVGGSGGSSGGFFSGEDSTGPSNIITAPVFISRKIKTTVWVPHGKVLILGGLYRRTKSKSLSTLPWLTQAEGWLNAAIQRLTPGSTPSIPLTPGLGNNAVGEGRRELVFMLKAELWRPAFTVPVDLGLGPKKEKSTPRDAITGFVDTITSLPEDIAAGIAGEVPESDIESSLGGPDE